MMGTVISRLKEGAGGLELEPGLWFWGVLVV